jgi:hypothetical protein
MVSNCSLLTIPLLADSGAGGICWIPLYTSLCISKNLQVCMQTATKLITNIVGERIVIKHMSVTFITLSEGDICFLETIPILNNPGLS